MRILFITAGAGRMYCGSCLRDGALAAALLRAGHDVLYVPTYTPPKIEAAGLGEQRVFMGGINVYLQYKSALFRHTPRWLDRLLDARPLLRLASRFSHLTAAHDLARLTIAILRGPEGPDAKEIETLVDWLASQPRFDAVVLPNSLLAGLAAPLKHRLGAPVFCLLSGEDMFMDEFPASYRDPALAILRRRAADFDGFIAHNRYYADFMTRFLAVDPAKVRVVRLGIDLAGFPDDCPPSPPRFTIGYLARICPQKGLQHLVEAFRILKNDPATANGRLRVAGYLGGEYRRYFDEIVERIRAWGLEEDFEYVGEVDREDKIRFLSSLSVFSVPVEYPEPKGQFVPEAMAAGIPVVAPRTGCLPEWIEATGGGLLCEPSDAASLAEQIGRIAQDPALATQLARAGQASVRRDFGADVMAHNLATVLSGPR
ncbi:glycosyltransferase family 4 protein [Candidatus Sumerlaeota bacterium]|nr:glycosyltransferase family 4 protein [Candidatus Sumerlaeota bacterium]